MERVEQFEALAPLLSAQLKKGVFTNNFLSRDDYAREIAQGLWAQEFPGGLLLFRSRTGYYVLNFYLQKDGVPALPDLDGLVVTEMAWRPREAEGAAAALERLRAAGFVEQFRRLRRERPAMAEANPVDGSGAADAAQHSGIAGLADSAQTVEILEFLRDNFDSLTGCLPSEEALAEDVAGGRVVCTTDGFGLTGVLHFARGRASTEIRHLAVRSDCRGQGLAGKLLSAYLHATGTAKSQVWARRGNTPAEHFYEKHQYRLDGWQSVVLLAGGKEQL